MVGDCLGFCGGEGENFLSWGGRPAEGASSRKGGKDGFLVNVRDDDQRSDAGIDEGLASSGRLGGEKKTHTPIVAR